MAIDCCPYRKAQKRLSAILLMLCGGDFELALTHAGISERCLQLWIKCFNDKGIDGITHRPRSGRPRLLKSEQIDQKILPVIDDPGSAGRHHWTAVSLSGWLKEHQGLQISYRTLVRYLHERDYARRIPRPMPSPPDKDKWIEKRGGHRHASTMVVCPAGLWGVCRLNILVLFFFLRVHRAPVRESLWRIYLWAVEVRQEISFLKMRRS